MFVALRFYRNLEIGVRGVKGEIIHHINKIRDDNSIFNLMVFKNNSSHIRFHKNQNAVKPSEIIFDGRKRVSLF